MVYFTHPAGGPHGWRVGDEAESSASGTNSWLPGIKLEMTMQLASIKAASVTLYFFARLSSVSPGCTMIMTQPAGAGHCAVGEAGMVGAKVRLAETLAVGGVVWSGSVVFEGSAGETRPGAGVSASVWLGAGELIAADRQVPSVIAREKLPNTRQAESSAARMPKLIWRRSFMPADLPVVSFPV